MHPECPDFDLCEACETHPIPVHPDKHPMLKIKSADTTIPRIQDIRERPERIISPEPAVSVSERHYDYDSGYMYNPSMSLTDFPNRSRSPMPQLQTPDELRSMSPLYNPYPVPPPVPSFPGDHQFYSPQCIPPGRYYPYRTPSVTPSIRPTSPFMPSAYRAASLYTQSGSVAPSPRSSRSGTPIHPTSLVWQSAYDSVGSDLATSAQEAPSSPLDPKNSPPSPATSHVDSSHATWMPSARDLDHLINGHALILPPKSSCEKAQDTLPGNNVLAPSDGNTPFQSPLCNEALLIRPASMTVPEPTDVVPVFVHRSLAALLDDYRSTASIEPSSLATSVVDEETGADNDVPVQKALTAGMVADITVHDGQNFPPGAEFVKCWRMINDGERDWPETTELVFVAGIPLLKESSPQSVRVGAVKVGSEVDLWTGELKVRNISRLSSNGTNFSDFLGTGYTG